jgi:hypothetical protein
VVASPSGAAVVGAGAAVTAGGLAGTGACSLHAHQLTPKSATAATAPSAQPIAPPSPPARRWRGGSPPGGPWTGSDIVEALGLEVPWFLQQRADEVIE